MPHHIAWVVFIVLGTVLSARAKKVLDLETDKDEILKLHNDYRKYHGSPALTWSSKLSSGAATWANTCVWEHSPMSSRKNQGENLFASLGYPVESAYSSAATSWYDEVALYDFNDPGKPDFSDIGHFTQLVWKESTELGCARAICPGDANSPFDSDGEWINVVCRYSPPGNVLSGGKDEYALFRENVLEPGSAAEPIATPVSCAGKTKTVKIKVGGKGTSCDAGKSAIQVVEMLGESKVCKWKSRCKQKGSEISVRATLKVPTSQVDLFVQSMQRAIKNRKFYDRWSSVQGEEITAPSRNIFKVCVKGTKGC